MMVQQNLILILLLWCSGAEAPFKILLRWNTVSRWFTDEGVNFLESCRDDKTLPVHAKRLICDGYMCFYQSPQVMMYQ